MRMSKIIRHLICGGGNGAHVLAGLASSRANTKVRVLSLYQDEAKRWNEIVKKRGFLVSGRSIAGEDVFYSKPPELITNDPKEAVANANIITFVVPAFAHDQYLKALAPHVQEGTTIVGIPSAAGFEFAVRGYLGKKAKTCSIMSFESLPWACRIAEFGHQAHVLGFKEQLSGAIRPSPKQDIDPVQTMQYLLGENPHLNTKGHLLGITLMGTNSYIHPCIMYGKWNDFEDGKYVDQPPLFYQGLSEYSADLLYKVSCEVVEIAKTIMKKRPDVDLTIVRNVYQWYLDCYGHQILDKSNLRNAMKTNPGYDGLTHPMRKIDEHKFIPDFSYRYLSEDVPFGLAVIRGIAEIAECPTPNMDTVLYWCQSKLGKEYLIDGKMKGRDIKETRSPMKYGMNTLEDILDF